MGTPIYGVLFLDPSPLSPLQLVKSRDTGPRMGDGIVLCR